MSFLINSTNNQSNIGATNIGFSKAMKAGYFVVNPANIKPYSFYDDLKKGENFYKDALKSVNEGTLSTKKNKRTKVFKKVLGCVLVVALSVLAYKKWPVIVNFIKNIKK